MGLIRKRLSLIGPRREKQADCLFDTGASRSFIRPELVRSLGLSKAELPRPLRIRLGKGSTRVSQVVAVMIPRLPGVASAGQGDPRGQLAQIDVCLEPVGLLISRFARRILRRHVRRGLGSCSRSRRLRTAYPRVRVRVPGARVVELLVVLVQEVPAVVVAVRGAHHRMNVVA